MDYSADEKKNLEWSEVKRIWKRLHADPEYRQNTLRPDVYDSWMRCYSYQLPCYRTRITEISEGADYEKTCEASQYLMQTAQPVIDKIAEFVEGTGFLVSLSDANGVTLIVTGDKKALEWGRENHLIQGLIAKENTVGTSGIPMSIILEKPISIYSYEHFCLFGITCTSTFAPIFFDNKLIGCIGMTAPYYLVSDHTLGMVVMAADQIQSIMILNRISNYHRTITNSLSDGVMVVSKDGTITYTNTKCRIILGLKDELLVKNNISSIFDQKNEHNSRFINILMRGQSIADEQIALYINGEQIKCHVTCTPLHSKNPADCGSVVIIQEIERINKIVGKWIGRGARLTFRDIIGKNQRFLNAIEIAHSAAKSDSNILITGESGTGKDIFAQAIHNESMRRNNPFIAINCAALPRELITSELFGYEDGAFTGAKKGGNIGKFELANHGTIFLDEIGDMPVDTQATLLRVLEEKSLMRLGGNKMFSVDVRIIAATNKNLEIEIENNRFRRDLYYRFGVIHISIPPLRERVDDLPLLTNYFLRIIENRDNRPELSISPGGIKMLAKHHWPGNVRELQNVLEGIIVTMKSNIIDETLVSSYMEQNVFVRSHSLSPSEKNDYFSSEITKEDLEKALKDNMYNKAKTAESLGISRKTLYKYLKKYKIPYS